VYTYNIVRIPSLTGKEVKTVEAIIIPFLISVAAGIVTYYICKWLDRK